MKKVLFMAAAVLGLSLSFIGCKPTENNGGNNGGNSDATVTGLTVRPAELTLLVNDEPVRLSYVTEPEGVKVNLVWTSSDEAVATVSDDGTVTPMGTGTANITATVKDTEVKGVCQVKVTSLEDNLVFTECYLGLVALDETNTFPFNHSTLGTINAHVGLGRVQLFTEGLYFNASGKIDGAQQGGWIYFTTPIALAYANENTDNPNMAQFPNGVSFSLGDYYITNAQGTATKTYTMTYQVDETTTELREFDLPVDANGSPLTHVAYPTKVDNDTFMTYMNAWLANFNEVGEFTQENYPDFAYAGIYGFEGPTLNLMQYVVDEEQKGGYESYPDWLWEYMPNAIVTGGELYIGGETGSSKHMYMIDYMNIDVQFVQTDEHGIPGLFVDFSEETGFTIKSTGVELGKTVNYTRGTMPSNKPARQHKGLNIFVDHALTFENAPMLPAREAKKITAPKHTTLK